jgi:uncharacterized membrane protein YphA (DoxX/SURF4 family)
MDPVVTSILRLALAVLFATAVSHKLRAPSEFAAAVEAYRVMPARGTRLLAVLLVVGELTATVLLLAPGMQAAGAGVAAVLLAAYAGAIAVNLARGRRDLDCGCAGPGARRPVGPALVLRNLMLLGAALAVLVPPSGRSLGWIDHATIVAAVVALASLYVGIDRLLANGVAVARLRGTA